MTRGMRARFGCAVDGSVFVGTEVNPSLFSTFSLVFF